MKHYLYVSLGALLVLGCGEDSDGDVASAEDAARAYSGLDASIDKAIELGFDGFNAATNAKIPTQTAKGASSGKLTVDGKVDQGSSSNKTMNLTEALEQYSDDGKLTYDTTSPLPTLDMKLSKVPTGTLDGTMAGTFAISGELEGGLTLELTFSGELEPGTDGALVQRKPGTTHIAGTATSKYGTYSVDITR